MNRINEGDKFALNLEIFGLLSPPWGTQVQFRSKISESEAIRADYPEIGVRQFGRFNWLGLWTLYLKEVRRFTKVWMQTLDGSDCHDPAVFGDFFTRFGWFAPRY